MYCLSLFGFLFIRSFFYSLDVNVISLPLSFSFFLSSFSLSFSFVSHSLPHFCSATGVLLHSLAEERIRREREVAALEFPSSVLLPIMQRRYAALAKKREEAALPLPLSSSSPFSSLSSSLFDGQQKTGKKEKQQEEKEGVAATSTTAFSRRRRGGICQSDTLPAIAENAALERENEGGERGGERGEEREKEKNGGREKGRTRRKVLTADNGVLLLLAIRKGDLERVKQLVEEGTPLDVKNVRKREREKSGGKKAKKNSFFVLFRLAVVVGLLFLFFPPLFSSFLFYFILSLFILNSFIFLKRNCVFVVLF